MAEANNSPGSLPVSIPAPHRNLTPLPLRGGSTPPLPEAATDRESRTLWYALYFPQLAALSETQQQRHLNELATLAYDVSGTVSFHPCALVLEIRSSLKYFGGMEAIHLRLQPRLIEQLQQWKLPETLQYAASPTATGSLLLAHGACNRLVYRRANLRSALGRLPVSVLQLEKEPARRLHNMGVRYLQDLWRLPTDGLRKRFGSAFLNQLHQALGRAPEPTHNYQPPPAFTTAYDLSYEVEDVTRLLPVADELLAQLCDFLQRRDLSASQLVFSLRHEQQKEGEGEGEKDTAITLGLRQPSRVQQHLMLLLETHLTHLSIPAPVIGIRLTVKKFDAFLGRNEILFRTPETNPPTTVVQAAVSGFDTGFETSPRFIEFIEHLQARLGDHCLKSIHPVAEHCPEYAIEQRDYAVRESAEKRPCPVAENPRPLWLLATPRELTLRRGKLYHRRSLEIFSGPERIETRWWSGTDIRRDYYVAQDRCGSRLWIYHEKTGAKRWFLHGLFA